MGGQAGDAARGARGLAAALAVGTYLAYFDRAVPGAVAPLVKHDLHLSDTALGFATATAAAIAYALVAIVLAAIDRGGRRRRDAALVGGMIAWTAGTATLAFAGTFGRYVAAEMLVGAGQAAFVPAAATAIVGAGGVPALGLATARFTSASTLGRSSALLVTGMLIAALGAAGVTLPALPAAWRAVFLVTALPNLAVIALVALRLRSPAWAGPAAVEERRPPPPAAVLIGCFLVATAPVILVQAIAAWYPMLLVRIAALSPAGAAMIAGTTTLVAAPLGMQLGGLLLDRRPARRERPGGTIAPALAVAGIALAAIGAVPALATAVAALALVDLVLGVAVAVGLAGIQALVAAPSRGRANSLFFALVTMVGVGLGPLVAGRLSDGGGATGTALAAALVEMAAATLALALAGHLLMAGAVRYRGGRGATTD